MRNKIILFTTMLLFACSSPREKGESDQLFAAMFPDIPMNLDIKFWEPSEDFYIGESIDLGLENVSRFSIKYTSPTDIYALEFIDGNWVRLQNHDIYIPPEHSISPKGVDLPGVAIVSLTPEFSRMVFGSVTIRIVVVATIYENLENTNKKTGAYIDLKLNL